MLEEIIAAAQPLLPPPPSLFAPYKDPVFFVVFFGFLMYGYLTCRFFKNGYLVILGIMVGSLVMPIALSLTFWPNEDYKQATRGLEIHLSDLCALVLLLYVLTARPLSQVVWFPPMTLPFIFFFIMVFISWTQVSGSMANPLADDPKRKFDLGMEAVFKLRLYPVWEMIKLLRSYLIFWVVVNVTKDNKSIEVVKFVASVIVIYLTAHALFDRYILHIHRINAGMGHYNNFNTFVGMLGMFLFPWIFYTKRPAVAGFFFLLVISSFVCIVLSISRTALAASLLAMAVGTPILLIRFFTVKNLTFIVLAIIGVVAITAKAFHTLEERFEHKNPTMVSYHNRQLLNDEGVMMADDHPFGVGMGNFSAWSILRYADATGAEIGLFAHNTFYLTLGEIGWPGLIAFVIYWLRFAQIALANTISRQSWRDAYIYATIMAVNLSLLFLFPQMIFQFTYRVTSVFLLAHIWMGIAVSRYLLLKERRREINKQRKEHELHSITT